MQQIIKKFKHFSRVSGTLEIFTQTDIDKAWHIDNKIFVLGTSFLLENNSK